MNGMNTMLVLTTACTFVVFVTTVLGGEHPDGVSKVSREQDALGNYKFSYAITNSEGDHFRKEGTDPLGRVIGSYGLTHADGSQRLVDYVADKDGFRAEVRSNEPGMISSDSAGITMVKLQPDLSLAVAATSRVNSGASFGTRLNADASKVSYENHEQDKVQQQESLENSPSDSRESNFEDYRPRNPVAYYPGRAAQNTRTVSPPTRLSDDVYGRSRLSPDTSDRSRLSPDISDRSRLSPDISDRSRLSADISDRFRSQAPSTESRPFDTYLPPLDPNDPRRPSYFTPRDRTSNPNSYTSTSRRPYIPPYGGFDDDPLPVDRRPGVLPPAGRGGFVTNEVLPPQTPTPAYGNRRYPVDDIPLSRDFAGPRFPQRSNFPSLPRLPGSLISNPPRSAPGPAFGPPPSSFDSGLRPDFVLRAVPIPNGIQAVRVDPESGRIYDRVLYPLYIRDGRPVYDRNVLLHNDDVSDEGPIRNRDSGYLDVPFRIRSPFRNIRNPAFNVDDEFVNRTDSFNRSFDPRTLSIPTARDLAWVQRQLNRVEGFDRTRYPSSSSGFPNNDFENNEYSLFNDFDDSFAGDSDSGDDAAFSRLRDSDQYGGDSFSRNPRLVDRLTPEDTKDISVAGSESLISDPKSSETDPKPSVVEKD